MRVSPVAAQCFPMDADMLGGLRSNRSVQLTNTQSCSNCSASNASVARSSDITGVRVRS